ncbi:DsbA family protein [Rummeliibacillus stabekisii]|uniref:DsbA family protein n=1 Tax=Rummeliibacillus stabekisii TaxID=241244 RepID=UPI003722EEE6
MSKFKLAVIGTVVVFALLAIIVIISNKQTPEETTIEKKEVDLTGQPLLGQESAPVTVVEFGDYKCPSCKAWGETVYPKLVEDYILSGDVKFSYVNVLFHGNESILGAMAAESVYKQDPNVYWDFHKALFDAQPAANHDGLWITMDKILELADKIPSINLEQLKQDVEQELTMKQVNIDKDLYTKHHVSQTPTVNINGVAMEDPFDYEAIKEAIDRELKDDENE